MSDFLEFYNELRKRFPLHLVIYQSKIMDWCIENMKIGCADDYPTAEHEGKDVLLVRVQHCDMKYCFAKAHAALKDWLMEYEGGYLFGIRRRGHRRMIYSVSGRGFRVFPLPVFYKKSQTIVNLR